MTIEANKHLAATFMRLLSDGQLEQAADCLKEDMQWKIVSTSRPGTFTGAQVINATKAMIAASADGQFRLSPVGMIAEGDKVAVEAVSLVNLKDGKVYNNKYHLLLTIAGDKVVECREYNDTAHFMDVMSHALVGVTIPKKS